ncbi:MAG: flagellar motor protein MotB, partial [Myxococcota bacterium]|nr:flagellar motor protein MotB [Myxococcota bacterium]
SGPSAPFWMVTYSDMVTLLLTFFVMLMAMASFEEVGRVEAVLESIRLALGAGGTHQTLMGVTPEEMNQPSEIEPLDELQPIMAQLRESLNRHVSDDFVRMTRTQTEIRVQLSDQVLFEPGRDALHPAAYSLLGGIAGALSGQPVNINVEGHTDATGDVKGNWELSALRAVAVVAFMQDRGGIDGRKLEARGYGPFRPASPGGEDATWDRRVELVIQSKSALAYDAIYKVEQITGGTDGR